MHLPENASETLLRLAALLGAPEPGSLAALREECTRAPWLAEGVAELQDTALPEWQGEHTRLFLNGFPKTACPAFASAWSEAGRDGQLHVKLAEIYRQAGLNLPPMPPDFLGALLECAVFLSERDDPSSQALLQRLWEAHLRPWVPRFAACLRTESRLGVYRALAEQFLLIFGGSQDDIAHNS